MPLFLQRLAFSLPSTPPPVQRQPLEEQEEDIINQACAPQVQRQPDEEEDEDNKKTSTSCSGYVDGRLNASDCSAPVAVFQIGSEVQVFLNGSDGLGALLVLGDTSACTP